MKRKINAVWEFIQIIILLFMIAGVVKVSAEYMVNQMVMECNERTRGLDLPHRWSMIDGCKVQMENGELVEPFRYMIINVHEGHF